MLPKGELAYRLSGRKYAMALRPMPPVNDGTGAIMLVIIAIACILDRLGYGKGE